MFKDHTTLETVRELTRAAALIESATRKMRSGNEQGRSARKKCDAAIKQLAGASRELLEAKAN